MVRGPAMPTAVLSPGDTLVFGRAPRALVETGPGQPRYSTLTLPHCAPHVSRVLGERLHVLNVGESYSLRNTGENSAR